MLKAEEYRYIAGKFGTPLYVFDEKEFLENYNDLLNTFRRVYPKYNISYSYKTNYTPYICSLIKEQGGYAEVVSDMEYDLARKLGYENNQIVYNGPAKGPALEEHIANGGINNIDNPSEALRICAFADAHPEIIIKTGLRINIDLGRGFVSRFGLEPDSEAMEIVLEQLKKRRNIKISGVHCHLSHARDLEAWKKRTEIILDAADKYVEGVPEYISLGSGMFGRMEPSFRAQFGDNIPDYSDYAKVTMSEIAKHYASVCPGKKPVVFTEPGATVVSKYISFISKVCDIKTVHDRVLAVTDGSFYNLGEVSLKKTLPMMVIPENDMADCMECDIAGYTCLEYDCMYKNYKGTVDVGSLAVFGNAGGYSIVSKPQFIRPNCAMVAYGKNGETAEIMRAETFDDVFSKFRF